MFIILSFFSYFFMCLFLRVYSFTLETSFVKENEISQYITKKAIFIKNEAFIPATENGEVKISLTAGERVRKNQEVFIINKVSHKTIMPGNISYYYDSNFETFSFSNIKTLSVEDILKAQNHNMIQKKEIYQKADIVLNVVDRNLYYIAFELTSDDLLKIKRGQKYKAYIGKEELEIELYDFYKDKDLKFVGIFSSNSDIKSILESRTVNLKIRSFHEKGLEIPLEAIVNYEGKKGVYIIDTVGIAKFKEIKNVLAQNSEFLLISNSSYLQETNSPINVNDEIILSPRNIKHLDIVRN